jgi:carboxymethylenebutenolidase
MRRHTLSLLALFLLGSLAVNAQEWAKTRLDASPRHREYVPIKHGDRTVQAFVVYPEVSKKVPVVILIHEIFGLSDWAKEMADELAAAGYIVVAPDLLSGAGPNGGNSDSTPTRCSPTSMPQPTTPKRFPPPMAPSSP